MPPLSALPNAITRINCENLTKSSQNVVFTSRWLLLLLLKLKLFLALEFLQVVQDFCFQCRICVEHLLDLSPETLLVCWMWMWISSRSWLAGVVRLEVAELEDVFHASAGQSRVFSLEDVLQRDECREQVCQEVLRAQRA